MGFILISLCISCCLLIQSIDGFVFKKHSYSVIIKHFNKKPDYIDAEIVNDDNNSKNINDSIIKRREKSNDDDTTRGINGITSLLKKGVNSITKMFEKDQKISNQKKEMNQAIDKIMQGTGVSGSIIGSLMKGVGSMLVDSFAESANDLDIVKNKINSVLQNNDEVTKLFNNQEISCLNPIQQSTSSFNMNGVVSKQFTYIFPIIASGGNTGSIVQATGNIENNNVYFNDIVLQAGQKVIRIQNNNGSKGKYIDV